MNANATFVRPALVYAGVAGATRLALLLAQAAYLRSLGDVQFGVYAFATLTEQILFTVVAYAFTNALGAKYAATNDQTDRANAVGTALVSVVIASAVLAVCWQFAAIWFSDAFLAKGADAISVARMTGISVGGTAVLTVALTIWQLDVRLKPFVIATAIQFGIASLGGVVAVVVWDLGSPGAFGAWTIGTWVAAMWSIAYLIRTQQLRYSRQMLRALARYGVPLIPGAFAAFLLQTIDRVLIRQLAGISAFARYSVVILIVSGLNATIIAAFRRIWTARMWGARGSAHEGQLHRVVLDSYFCLQAGVVLLLTCYGDVALRLLGGPDFDVGTIGPAVGVTYLGYVLFGGFDVVSAGIFFSGRTYQYSVLVAVATVVEAIVVAALAVRYGPWAGAIANLLAYCVFFVSGERLGRAGFNAEFRFKPMFALWVVTGAGASVAIALRSLGLVGESAAALSVLVGVGLLLLEARKRFARMPHIPTTAVPGV